MDRVLSSIHDGPTAAADPPTGQPTDDEDLLRQLGMLAPVPDSPRPQVATAPPVGQAPAVAAPAYSSPTSTPSADAAAGNPAGGLPAAALWVSDFPQGIFVSRVATPTQAGQAIIAGDGYTVPALGSVLVQGMVAKDGIATALQLSTDGGQEFGDLAGGYVVAPGQTFTFGQVVAQGDQVNVATAAASSLSRLVVAYIPGLAVDQTTATNVTISGDVNAKITGPVSVETAPGTSIDASVTGSVDATVTGTVDVSGPVTVETAAGTSIDASISGPVTIETASGTPIDATITGTVNIAASQVVQVENTASGSLTVAGSVDIGNTPNVTIDTTGGAVEVSPQGTTDVNVTNATLDSNVANVVLNTNGLTYAGKTTVTVTDLAVNHAAEANIVTSGTVPANVSGMIVWVASSADLAESYTAVLNPGLDLVENASTFIPQGWQNVQFVPMDDVGYTSTSSRVWGARFPVVTANTLDVYLFNTSGSTIASDTLTVGAYYVLESPNSQQSTTPTFPAGYTAMNSSSWTAIGGSDTYQPGTIQSASGVIENTSTTENGIALVSFYNAASGVYGPSTVVSVPPATSSSVASLAPFAFDFLSRPLWQQAQVSLGLYAAPTATQVVAKSLSGTLSGLAVVNHEIGT